MTGDFVERDNNKLNLPFSEVLMPCVVAFAMTAMFFNPLPNSFLTEPEIDNDALFASRSTDSKMMSL